MSYLPPLTLVGTILGGSERIGVFLDQTTPCVIRLRVGEGHAGRALHAIEPGAAILEQGRREATLPFSPREKGSLKASSLPQPQCGCATSLCFSASGANAGDLSTGRPVERQWAGEEPPLMKGGAPPPGRWFDGDGQLVAPSPTLGRKPQLVANEAAAPLLLFRAEKIGLARH